MVDDVVVRGLGSGELVVNDVRLSMAGLVIGVLRKTRAGGN